MMHLRRQFPLLAAVIFWLLAVVAVPAFASVESWPAGQEAFEREVGQSAPTFVPKAAGGGPKLIGPAGDAAARGLTRVERFQNLASGFNVGEARFTLNQHVINSLRKSGRRHIDPESMLRALRTQPTPGTPGSRVFADPSTGTSFFVNEANQVVGVHPAGFR